MSSFSAARRHWLRGEIRGKARLRPPWSVAEAQFLEACTRCDACIARCEAQLLRRGDGGYPEFHPAIGGCTFCGACAAACRAGALDRGDGTARPWSQIAIAGDGCLAAHGVACASCRESCDAGALRVNPVIPRGFARPVIDARACTGCGACVPACPAGAITLSSLEIPWKSQAW